ncbi:uncharacterized protein A4U43_C08F25700 [Asparagus officinalis]|nr:uncharacterized protein A4U43_C08F25700 [Asparagus officinalis]
MGSCFSSFITNKNKLSALSAKVVDLDGSFKEYKTRERVSNVLATCTHQLSSNCFLYDASNIFHTDSTIISPMNPQDSLRAGGVYFVLSTEILVRALSASVIASSQRRSRLLRKQKLTTILEVDDED